MVQKLFSLAFLLASVFIASCCDAAGGVTHMFIAKEAIMKLNDKELQTLILNNMDAYLVGSNYANTGYIRGTHYGEESHSENFINTFIIYLREKYPFPEQQNPKLVAFALGCAAHTISDQMFHGVFMNKIAAEDFQGNWNKAHQQSETALDVLIMVEQNQWGVRPSIWWIPMSDLLGVYQRMGQNHYSLSEIFWGNAVYSFAGISERAISPFAYGYLRIKMPWLSQHYTDTASGGMNMTEEVTARYLESVWKRVTGKIQNVSALNRQKVIQTQANRSSPTFTFAPIAPGREPSNVIFI